MALRRTSDVDPEAELEALRQMSEQFGVPGIDLNQICIRLEDLELLPREIADRRLILPVLVRDDRVFVAMTNPTDKKVVDELEFVTGKRVFRMAPIHHHFEKLGWQEPKIVVRFWIISVMLALIGLASLKLR